MMPVHTDTFLVRKMNESSLYKDVKDESLVKKSVWVETKFRHSLFVSLNEKASPTLISKNFHTQSKHSWPTNYKNQLWIFWLLFNCFPSAISSHDFLMRKLKSRGIEKWKGDEKQSWKNWACVRGICNVGQRWKGRGGWRLGFWCTIFIPGW